MTRAAAALFVLLMALSLLLWAGPASHGHPGDAGAESLKLAFIVAPEVAVILMAVAAGVFCGFFACLKDLEGGLRVGTALAAALAAFADGSLMLYAIAGVRRHGRMKV